MPPRVAGIVVSEERNQQISIRHSRASRIVELHLALANPAVADAWLHGSGSPEELTQTELSQFTNLCRLTRPNFGGRFLDFMDGVVAQSAAEPPVDLSLEAWKVAFASEASRTS